MTTYHRGRKQSVYRKRADAVSLAIGNGTATARALIRSAPSTGQGNLLIKSVRATVLATFPTTPAATRAYASGWVGYARSNALDSDPNFELEQSDVFGVAEWVVGDTQDQLVNLPLKGITLTSGEAWFLVARRTSGNSSASILVASLLYAQMGTDAT